MTKYAATVHDETYLTKHTKEWDRKKDGGIL